MVTAIANSQMKLPQALLARSPIREYHAGAVVFQTGEPGEEMFVVTEGEVDIFVGGEVVETVGNDMFFGELALIDQSPRSATAVARTNCKVAVVNQHRFMFAVDEVPFFALQVMKIMADRLRRKVGPPSPEVGMVKQVVAAAT